MHSESHLSHSRAFMVSTQLSNEIVHAAHHLCRQLCVGFVLDGFLFACWQFGDSTECFRMRSKCPDDVRLCESKRVTRSDVFQMHIRWQTFHLVMSYYECACASNLLAFAYEKLLSRAAHKRHELGELHMAPIAQWFQFFSLSKLASQ